MLVLLMGHLIGDYYLQWDKLIQMKKSSFKHLLLHVFIYTLPFVGIVIVFNYHLLDWLVPLSIIFISHMLIDIGKKYLDQYNSDKKYIFRNFCIDQLSHIGVLAIYSSSFIVHSIWVWLLFIVIMIIQPIPLMMKLYKMSS